MLVRPLVAPLRSWMGPTIAEHLDPPVPASRAPMASLVAVHERSFWRDERRLEAFDPHDCDHCPRTSRGLPQRVTVA